MTPKEILEDGWNSVNLEYNKYTSGFFEDRDLDPTSIQKFLDEEVDEYRLVGLSEADDYDYALERKESIDGSC